MPTYWELQASTLVQRPIPTLLTLTTIVYYEDFAMTVYDGMLDVSGVSFYEDADYVSIDNDNSLITASYHLWHKYPKPSAVFSRQCSNRRIFF